MLPFIAGLSRKAALPALAFGLSSLLAGCGAGVMDTSTTEATLSIHGLVHGGQNPVSGATIGLYKVGMTGLSSKATNILTSTVTTDANGNFNLGGLYGCTSSTDQMYITATMGNPGLGMGTNPALSMVAALGDCGNLGASTFILINEVTTAAAAWGLAPFATDYAHIGATGTNLTGIRNAFRNAQVLATTATGQATSLPSNEVTETGKLYAMADALAGCVNSDGTTGCNKLFAAATPPGGTAPTDTFGAALNIVHYPANNVAGVWNSIGSQVPFPTTLTKSPKEWTMSLTVSGGGLSLPTAMAIDAQGYAWFADYYGGLTELSPQGTVLSPASGFGSGLLSEVYGLTVDTGGNVWATIEEQPAHYVTKGSVAKFSGSQSTTPGTLLGVYADNSINYPESLFGDSNGTIDIGNYATTGVTIYDLNGNLLTSGLGQNVAQFPVSVFPDVTHGVWLANQPDQTITDAPSNATAYNVTCCSNPNSLVGNTAADIWVSNYGSDSVSEVSPAGVVLVNQASVGGISSPSGVALDGAQNVWVSNFHGASISEVAGGFGTLAAGTAISPSTGYGLDVSLVEPYSLGADKSGNVWVANYAANNVVMFFGLAAPAATPVQNMPVAP